MNNLYTNDITTMKILTTIVLLFLTVNFPAAEEKDAADQMQKYDIEIIIFEDAHARYINSETWQHDAPDDTGPLIDKTTSNKTTDNLDKLSLSEFNAGSYNSLKPKILSGEYKRINGSSEYNVLFYSAWRQTGLDENNAFDINIDELVNNHNNKSQNAIHGHLKVVLARYLHFYGDLDYQRLIDKSVVTTNTINTSVDASAQSTETNLISKQSYPMKIHRRMRSKELHYIDHPLVGILVQINPTEKVEKEETKKQ